MAEVAKRWDGAKACSGTLGQAFPGRPYAASRAVRSVYGWNFQMSTRGQSLVSLDKAGVSFVSGRQIRHFDKTSLYVK